MTRGRKRKYLDDKIGSLRRELALLESEYVDVKERYAIALISKKYEDLERIYNEMLHERKNDDEITEVIKNEMLLRGIKLDELNDI